MNAKATPKFAKEDRKSFREKTVKYKDFPAADAAKELLKQQRVKVAAYHRFVPKTLITQLHKTHDTWDVTKRTACDVFWCASAFIDISGFSSLASDLQSAEDAEKGVGGGTLYARAHTHTHMHRATACKVDR